MQSRPVGPVLLGTCSWRTRWSAVGRDVILDDACSLDPFVCCWSGCGLERRVQSRPVIGRRAAAVVLRLKFVALPPDCTVFPPVRIAAIVRLSGAPVESYEHLLDEHLSYALSSTLLA